MQDRLEVRIFTLADYATVPPDNKLYITGAGVNQMFLPQIPGGLGPLSLAVRLTIPSEMAAVALPLEIRVLQADGSPVGRDPIARGVIQHEIPPDAESVVEVAVNLAIGLGGFPVEAEGTIFFRLIVAGHVLGALPLKIGRAKPQPDAPQAER